ncbi:ATP-binding protein [Denitratisoma sp. agr-D3]
MDSPAPLKPDLQRQIASEQVHLLFRHTKQAQATNLMVASVCLFFLWDILDHGVLLAWWSTILVLVTARWVMSFYYRRFPDAPVPWPGLMTGTAICSGLAWGTIGCLCFIPAAPIPLLVMTAVLGGMAAGTVASHSSWLPAAYGYIIPALLPLTLRYLYEPGQWRALGFLVLIYLINVLVFSRDLSRTLTNSIQLRLENQGLVEQLQAEMRVAETAKVQAENANQAKSKFLAAASHDLRQPLHAIGLFLESLRHEPDPVRAAQIFSYLDGAYQSLEGLLNELLDISKLEAGLFKPQLQAFPLQQLFDSLDREMWPLAEEKGLVLRFAPTWRTVRSDPNMLARVLRNIITNAINYTAQGGVLVGCRHQQGRVAVAVYDTGPGIPAEYHEAIFREFYQLDNPERDRRKGLGLGLSIVDGLCRVLDHPVGLKSRMGAGTVFSVSVPTVDFVIPATTGAEPWPTLDFKGLAVLVVDDEPLIREGMVQVLRRWGCQGLAAESVDEALAAMATQSFIPDIIFADYRLRGEQTGSEAIRAIRQAIGRDIPAAILTGDTSPERLREADAGGLVLLHKPVHVGRLQATLAQLGKRVTPPAAAGGQR